MGWGEGLPVEGVTAAGRGRRMPGIPLRSVFCVFASGPLSVQARLLISTCPGSLRLQRAPASSFTSLPCLRSSPKGQSPVPARAEVVAPISQKGRMCLCFRQGSGAWLSAVESQPWASYLTFSIAREVTKSLGWSPRIRLAPLEKEPWRALLPSFHHGGLQ